MITRMLINEESARKRLLGHNFERAATDEIEFVKVLAAD